MQFKEVQIMVEICSRMGVEHVILSPGSRSAPLTVGFARHLEIMTHVIPDERSAGYIGMGIAQNTGKPVVLVCTSGTAAVNYAPAIVEAYYQHIPLIVMTADRPSEWIDQGDGQTIHQENLYGKHVKTFVNMPASSLTAADREMIKSNLVDAIRLAKSPLPGPVHINVPFREPFYHELSDENKIPDPVNIDISENKESKSLRIDFSQLAKSNILIIAGQNTRNEQLLEILNKISQKSHIPVITECHSNLHEIEESIKHHDLILAGFRKYEYPELKPDVLITFGDAIISKALKTVVRRWKIRHHWHIQEAGPAPDVFQSISDTIHCSPEDFFRLLDQNISAGASGYAAKWQLAEKKVLERIHKIKQSGLAEFTLTQSLLNHLPDYSVLHIGNSMPVRWANMAGIKGHITVYSNRGTSGIDGVMSTAVGHAMVDDRIHTVIIGDMSFFYDRNAFWHNEVPANMRIILMNNHGGGIFRFIDGPATLPECDEYFVTEQRLTAENLAKDYHLEYSTAMTIHEFENRLKTFFEPAPVSKILEVETNNDSSMYVFKHLIKGEG